ncbi:hypothetical protein [Burkholderia pseudomallei]|uniref:hypothetical protein n=1 Tax=Burkholderia pseudomallei TaxID=28450 RepID=UPI00105D94E0|nr:hypothetical protein [Burkholderia pseudomallei]
MDQKTELLYKVVSLIVKENINNQVFSTQSTLDFYREIEDKTDEDHNKIARLEKGVKSLSSPEYAQEAENILVEEYSRLPLSSLQFLYESIMLEVHMAEIGLTLAPRMLKLQEDVIYGTAQKKVVH